MHRLRASALSAGVVGCAVGLLFLAKGGSAGSFDPVATEVAVGQGTLPSGTAMPLPYFSDGTQATLGQCSILVGLAHVNGTHVGGLVTIDVRAAGLVGTVSPDDVFDHSSYNYLIIARRDAPPTRAGRTSWGRLKSRSLD